MLKVGSLLMISLAVSSFAGASVQFNGLKDGSKVKNPVVIKMKVSDKTLRPAGEDADDKKTGHHHIIVDGGPMPMGEVIPADQTHLHFGKAQDKAELMLPVGPHTLTLQFADGAHRSYGPEWSQTIRITVLDK